MLKQDYYNDFFEFGQQKINFSFFELHLPDDDPVYTLKKVMEDLDFSGLLACYSDKGRTGYNPIMMYAVVTYANMRGVTSMGTLVVFGFLKGFQPIAGFSYGAKDFKRLRESIMTSSLWSTIFCVIVGILMFLFSTQIIAQFANGNEAMILVGKKSLMANGLSFFLFGFYTVYSSLFLALGKGTAGFILGACRQGICFVPVIFLLPMILGINGILYAQPIADILSVIITVFMALNLHKQLSKEEQVLQN